MNLLPYAIALSCASIVISVIAMLVCAKAMARLNRWEDIYSKAVSDDARVPDMALIKQWKDAMERLPEGSPKWTAYRNRLISVGAISGD